jgi:hypothetical protein
MNSPVIANAVKQSMSLDCMDCRALACPEFIEGRAVTKALFKGRVRYLPGYGGLAMTVFFASARGRWPWRTMTPDYMDRHALLAMTVQGLSALSDWMRQAVMT